MINLPLNIDFSGKVVVVTGAGGLICGAMARAFAQSGAKVAALDLNEDAVKALANELKSEGFICEGYKANVLEPEALEAVHQQVLPIWVPVTFWSTVQAATIPVPPPTTSISMKPRRVASPSLIWRLPVLTLCSS